MWHCRHGHPGGDLVKTETLRDRGEYLPFRWTKRLSSMHMHLCILKQRSTWMVSSLDVLACLPIFFVGLKTFQFLFRCHLTSIFSCHFQPREIGKDPVNHCGVCQKSTKATKKEAKLLSNRRALRATTWQRNKSAYFRQELHPECSFGNDVVFDMLMKLNEFNMYIYQSPPHTITHVCFTILVRTDSLLPFKIVLSESALFGQVSLHK